MIVYSPSTSVYVWGAMTSVDKTSVCIDAATSAAADLAPVLREILCATNPQKFGLDHVTLFVDNNDSTDWPETPWLTVDRADGSQQRLETLLGQDQQTVLLSLNEARVHRPHSMLLVSDFHAAALTAEPAAGNLLKRLRNKIGTHRSAQNLGEFDSVAGFSCYSVDALAKLEAQPAPNFNVLPLGVDPVFFGRRIEHRMVEHLSFDTPFMWLTAVTQDGGPATLTSIDAVHLLRKLGAFVELKIVMPSAIDGHPLDRDSRKHIEKKLSEHAFVEVIEDCSNSELAEHYRMSDGFIWGQRTDRNHRFLLDAMACGLPVVAASSEIVKRILGSKLRYFRDEDVDDLARTLERSMADIHFRIIGSARNHKRSMSHTWEKCAAELFRLLQACHDEPHTPEALAS